MATFVLKASLFLVLWPSLTDAAFAISPTTHQAAEQRVADNTNPRPQDAAPSIQADGLNTDLVLQIIEASRVVAPGGVVILKYVLYSTEGRPGRMRLHVQAPLSWSVLDADRLQREWLLEAWDIVTEELRVAVPPDALVGPNERIRVTAEMIDVPGVAEALTHVQVLSAAGVRPGGTHVAVTTMLGASQLGASGFDDAQAGGTLDLSAKLGKQTNVSLTYRQGPQESVSNHRYYLEEKYLSGSILHHSWDVQFGGRVFSTGTAITGPSVNGDGLAMRRSKGRVLTEIVLARPTIFTGEGAGHLWRGSSLPGHREHSSTLRIREIT